MLKPSSSAVRGQKQPITGDQLAKTCLSHLSPSLGGLGDPSSLHSQHWQLERARKHLFGGLGVRGVGAGEPGEAPAVTMLSLD